MKKYTVVETRSVFTHRFVLDSSLNLSEQEILNAINSGNIEELSQKHLGETITSISELTAEEIISLDNDYISMLDESRQRDLIEHWARENKKIFIDS